MTIATMTADISQVDAAEALVELCGENIRYEKSSKCWLTFQPTTGWIVDDDNGEIQEKIVTSLRHLGELVPEELPRFEKKKFTTVRSRSVKKLETAGAISSISSVAARKKSVGVSPSQIDARPDLLGTPNGVVNLRTGKLSPFSHDEIITRRVPITYNPTATCPRWEKFLREVLGPDKETQEHFQRLVGYLFTGETREQQMWLLIGAGSNGKSTLLRTLMMTMGPGYSQQAAEEVLVKKSTSGGASSELVRLKGVRTAVLTETDHGQALHESRVKALVSGDVITARALYENYQQFAPMAKYLLATNHLPNVKGSDEGIWRRLVVIPFLAHFTVGADPKLEATLDSELEGILNWAVRGAVLYYRSGLGKIPAKWKAATDDYRTDQDVVTAFLASCTKAKGGNLVPASDLYAAYQAWSARENLTVLEQAAFGNRLTNSGKAVRTKYGHDRRWHWKGLVLTK